MTRKVKQARTKKQPVPHSTQSARASWLLAEARLKLSGLGKEDADRLGMRALTAAETSSLHPSFKAVPAILLPYFSLDGKTPLAPRPKHPPFYRVRYLTNLVDFGSQMGRKPQRYAQEPESGTCAYLPRGVDWESLAADPTRPIVITEGELKAAKSCKEGFPTIGLGGVYNYRSAKLGILLLPELKRFTWIRRSVYIAFDSDYRTNPQVCKALFEFAETLADEGAYPFVITLPALSADEKTGLDDFLVSEGAKGMRSLIDTAEPLTLADSLWQLNKRVIYVRNPGLIVDLRSSQKLSPAIFKEAAYAPTAHAERTLRSDGTLSLKRVSAAASWLKWPLRSEVESLTYAPGQPRIVNSNHGAPPLLNTWPGWGVEPKPGNVSLFLKLVDHLFNDAEVSAKTWFLRWCAYPLQYPGTKLFTSAVLHGVRHGTGKSLLGFTLGKIYGKNFAEITQGDLHSSFNEWAESKQFVLGDDVTGSNRRQDADFLKKLITQKELRVNPKYIPSYVVPDCINYLFTSNHPDAFFLEDDDRRFFVHEITVGPLSEEFYADYDLWLHAGGGAAVFHWLKNLELADFNPAAPAMRTAAKDRMIADIKSDLGAWVERLRMDPDGILRSGSVSLEGDLFTNRELLSLYDPAGATGTTANGLGRELKRAGFVQVCAGKPVRTSKGLDRYYAIRAGESWREAKLADIVKHLEERFNKSAVLGRF